VSGHAPVIPRSVRYLALDTATDRPTFVIGPPGVTEPGAEVALAHRHDLSRDIDRTVRDLLAANQLTAASLEGVVVADGPGSFTGLRIGIAFAKGFCRAANLPLIAVPSLLGAAWKESRGSGVVVAEFDALRGDVYRAVYRFMEFDVVTIEAPRVVPRGTGVPDEYRRATEVDASARALLSLVHVPGAAQAIADPGSWEPSYGRLAEAEARLNARQAGR
jgi:tRNA threonylcarbamoyl adenosine modification protein YeaZ